MCRPMNFMISAVSPLAYPALPATAGMRPDKKWPARIRRNIIGIETAVSLGNPLFFRKKNTSTTIFQKRINVAVIASKMSTSPHCGWNSGELGVVKRTHHEDLMIGAIELRK